MTDQQTPEVFRGHLEECLKHLLNALFAILPKGSRGASKAKQPIAAFCGVSTHTVTQWLYHGQIPIGEALIRMMCYLDMIGYRVIELERMSKSMRYFAELIGFGLLTANQASQLLGYTNTTTLYRILRRVQKAGNSKERIMWATWKEHREALERKKEEIRSTLTIGATQAAPKQTPEPTPHTPEATPQPQPAPKRIEAIFHFMEGLLCLLEEELETANGPKESPTGSEHTVRLQGFSARFNALCLNPQTRSNRKDKDGA